jgi:hypothetical protein
MKKILLFISTIAAISLTSCLKDKPNTDFSSIGTVLELPYAGLQYFGLDAVTDTHDTVVLKFGVNLASAKPLSTATNYTIAVDYALMTAYQATNSAVTYEQMPTGSYAISKTTGTIAAGKRLDSISVTVYRALLDPSKSYMLPIKLASTSNGILSGNFNAHYYHFIGNDFAGSYTWDYRRYQNGTGPGIGKIPSDPANAGSPPDITGLGQAGTIIPISPTEFQMQTGYNGQGVNYDVTFTRSVDPTTHIVSYTNWSVQFLAGDIAKWTAAGIANMVPPAFTVPPPATSNDPKFFELNYVSGGASPRYIDDTYHK